MVGIVGSINNIPNNSKKFIPNMIKTIKFTNTEHVIQWNDESLAVASAIHKDKNPDTQPVFAENRNLRVMMEGNLFDYEESQVELIKNGHKFKHHESDAEYILHLYEELGNDAFKELNGCFIIVIYNSKNRELVIANDRFSSRLLFYYTSGNGEQLIFGTQMSSILVYPNVPRILDKQSIFEFFTLQRVLGSKTYYKNIKVLKPAHLLKHQKGKVEISPFWQMKYSKPSQETLKGKEYYSKKLAFVMKQSIERKTRRNHRYGLFLSAGLDSRMVLAASNKIARTYTFGNSKSREVELAEELSKIKDCKHVFLKRSLNHYLDLIDVAVKAGDGMFNFYHAHSVGFFKEILKESDVIFHGNPPELFFRGSGLPHKSIKLPVKNFHFVNVGKVVLDDITNENLPYKILKEMNYSLFDLNPEQLFNKPFSANFEETLINSVKDILTEADNKVVNIYDKFSWFDIYYTSRYPSFLFQLTNRQFIDERTFLFDNDVYDFYLEMPISFRLNKDVWLAAIAELNFDIASVFDANTDSSPFKFPVGFFLNKLCRVITKKLRLPKIRALRDSGYYSAHQNMTELSRCNQDLQKRLTEIIKDPEYLDPAIFDIERILEMVKEHLTGKKDYNMFLYALITFGRWNKLFGPNATNEGEN